MEPPQFSRSGPGAPQGGNPPYFVASPSASMAPPDTRSGGPHHHPGPGKRPNPYLGLPNHHSHGPMHYQGNAQGPWAAYSGAAQHPPPAPWPRASNGPPAGTQISSFFHGGREALEAARTWHQRVVTANAAAESGLRSLLGSSVAVTEEGYENALETAIVRSKERRAARLGVEAAGFAERWWAPQLSGSLFRLTAGDLKHALERGNIEGDWMLHPLPPEGRTAAAAAAAGDASAFDQTPLRAKEIVEKLETMMLTALQANAEARAHSQRHGVPLALHQNPQVASGAAAAAAAKGGGHEQESMQRGDGQEQQQSPRDREQQQQRQQQQQEREEMPPPLPRAPPRSGQTQRKSRPQLRLQSVKAGLRVEEEEDEEEEEEGEEESEEKKAPAAVKRPVGRPRKAAPQLSLLKKKRKMPESVDTEDEDRILAEGHLQKQRGGGTTAKQAKKKKKQGEPLGPNGCWRSALCPKEFGHNGNCNTKVVQPVERAPPAPAAAAVAPPGVEKRPAPPPPAPKPPKSPEQAGDSQGDDDPSWSEQQATVERMRQARRRSRTAGRQRKRQLPVALTPLDPMHVENLDPAARRDVSLGPSGCWRSALCDKERGHPGWCNSKARRDSEDLDDKDKVALGPNGCWRSALCDKASGHPGGCNKNAGEGGEGSEGPGSPSRSVTLETVELTIEDDDGESSDTV